jgi:hypothetical protein
MLANDWTSFKTAPGLKDAATFGAISSRVFLLLFSGGIIRGYRRKHTVIDPDVERSVRVSRNQRFALELPGSSGPRPLLVRVAAPAC